MGIAQNQFLHGQKAVFNDTFPQKGGGSAAPDFCMGKTMNLFYIKGNLDVLAVLVAVHTQLNLCSLALVLGTKFHCLH